MIKVSQQPLKIKIRQKTSKTQPASNPQTITLDKKQAVFGTQNPSSSISKHSTKISPSSKQILSSERYQFLLMESQVRKLNRRIEIENQLAKNRKLYKRVQEQIKAQEEQIKEKKRLMIQNRIEQIEKSKKQRKQKQIQSDRTVAQLKLKERKKQYILQKLLEKNKIQHEECYQNALLERKLLLRPINFEEIETHEKKYLNNKRNHKTVNYDDYDGEDSGEIYKNKSKNQSLRYKGRQNRSQSKSLSSRKDGSSQNTKRKLEVKSSIQQYLETRKKEEKRIEQLKQLLQKQKEYGNRVQIQFHKNRAKTESIQIMKEKQRQYAEEKGRSIIQRNKILKNMKKPLIPEHFNKNVQERRKQEIEKVVRSSNSPEEKMLRLNMMSQAQCNQLRLRNRPEDLERLNKINMMRAELLLNFH